MEAKERKTSERAKQCLRFRTQFLDTPFPNNKTTVDYIFVIHSPTDVNMKTKVVDFVPASPEELPVMEKAVRRESLRYMLLKPMILFPDPFRGGSNQIALCELYDYDKPANFNTRHTFREFFDRECIGLHEPLMGFEQEYFILDRNGKILGLDVDIKSVNSLVNYGQTACLEREVAEQHLKACMLAGLSIYGTVKETQSGQWEYQLGPAECLRLADELIVSRYLLNRVAELFNVTISFAPVHYKDASKTMPITSGLHLNYSTKETRAENGIQTINEFIERLSSVDNATIFPYYDRTGGAGTTTRLSGMKPFDFRDLNTKRQYFRIPQSTQLSERGYFEDRRPSADCDPYTAMLAFLKSLYTEELICKLSNGHVGK